MLNSQEATYAPERAAAKVLSALTGRCVRACDDMLLENLRNGRWDLAVDEPQHDLPVLTVAACGTETTSMLVLAEAVTLGFQAPVIVLSPLSAAKLRDRWRLFAYIPSESCAVARWPLQIANMVALLEPLEPMTLGTVNQLAVEGGPDGAELVDYPAGGGHA